MKQTGRYGGRRQRGDGAQPGRGGPQSPAGGGQTGPNGRPRAGGRPPWTPGEQRSPHGPAQRSGGGQHPAGERGGQHRATQQRSGRSGAGGNHAPGPWPPANRRAGAQRQTGWLHVRPWSPDAYAHVDDAGPWDDEELLEPRADAPRAGAGPVQGGAESDERPPRSSRRSRRSQRPQSLAVVEAAAAPEAAGSVEERAGGADGAEPAEERAGGADGAGPAAEAVAVPAEPARGTPGDGEAPPKRRRVPRARAVLQQADAVAPIGADDRADGGPAEHQPESISDAAVVQPTPGADAAHDRDTAELPSPARPRSRSTRRTAAGAPGGEATAEAGPAGQEDGGGPVRTRRRSPRRAQD